MKPITTNHAGLYLVPAMLLAAVLVGCGEERLVEATREADRRQAQQNDQIARVVNEETLVRQQVAKLQNDLRADQAVIAQQRDQLEAERREAAGWRQWAEFWKPIAEVVGVVAVVIAVLAYCGFLVGTLRQNGPADAALTESLVKEILSVEDLPPTLLLPDEAEQLQAPSIAGLLTDGKRSSRAGRR